MTGTGDRVRRVLVVNCGSSSLKYELLDPNTATRHATGSVDRIGEGASRVEHTVGGGGVSGASEAVADHAAAFAVMLRGFEEHGPSLATLDAIGHRVVTAGDAYDSAVLIDDAVCAAIGSMSPFAPLHNPANLLGIELARRQFPRIPAVAVFDTAFFAHLPEAAATYAIGVREADGRRLRRHGAHGTSHRYVSRVAAEALAGRSSSRMVVLHLGNGASASAVLDGRAVETSMGATPLEGLVMGTRSGDIDPAIPGLLQALSGMSTRDVDDLLNHRSGLLGLCGHRDMRDVHAAIRSGDPAAALALEVYLHRIRKYVGAYAAVMGGIDALVFTAGVGENDPVVRAGVVDPLGFLGLHVDPQLNEGRTGSGAASAAPAAHAARQISPPGSRGAVLVVPTDEELAIACEVEELLTSGGRTP